MRDGEHQTRTLEPTKVGDYVLLNNEKLGRVLDLIEHVREAQDPKEASAFSKVSALDRDVQILALYDRLGGAVKYRDRKVSMGTFWDFKARGPKDNVTVDEEEFEDEYVLVPKKTKKKKNKETTAQRIKRLNRGTNEKMNQAAKKVAKKATKKND